MKQSTRLLSMLLALVMLVGVMSVAAGAAGSDPLVKGGVAYDSIDNAALTPEQIATLLVDLVDGLLADIGDTLDLSILGELDYRSVDQALSSLIALRKSVNALTGIAGDVADLNFDPLKKSGGFGLFDSTPVAYQRSDGDLLVLTQLVNFLGCDDNASVLKKLPYGIGGNPGINLGTILNGVLDVDLDILKLLKGLVFDNLLRSSYAYPRAEDASLYTTSVTTYDKYEKLDANTQSALGGGDSMLNAAIYNLLTDPQDKVWFNESGTMVRRWDPDSVILPDVSAASINLNNNSILKVIDNVIQYAYEELGTIPLNNDLKKIIMEAMGVDFVRAYPSQAIINAAPAAEKTDNYFCEAAFWSYNGNYYFRDEVTEDVKVNGEVQKDANGNTLTTTYDRYFVADLSGRNDLFDLVNWDYEFTGSTYDFAANLTTYGSIFGQLNHLLYTILNTAINDSIKDEIVAFCADSKPWFIDGDNSKLTENLIRIAKYVLCKYTSTIFGKNPTYVDVDAEGTPALASFVSGVKACATVEDLVAYIAIPLFDGILPELVMPTGGFTPGLQVEQLGAIALRQAISDITPALKYDDKIFAAGSLESATGRVMATHTTDEWQDIILEMGVDLGLTYLDNITNIDVNTAKLAELKAGAVAAGAAAWMGPLEEVVDWAIAYVSLGNANGALNGINPTAYGAVRGTYNGNAFSNLSRALNAILPLGMVCGSYEKDGATINTVDASGNLNVENLFWLLYDSIADLNIPQLLSIFGRNSGPKNLLLTDNAATTVLKLLNQILGLVIGNGSLFTTTNIDSALLNQANLQNSLYALLRGLDTRKTDILRNVLPIVAAFMSDWSGEQELGTPEYTIAKKL